VVGEEAWAVDGEVAGAVDGVAAGVADGVVVGDGAVKSNLEFTLNLYPCLKRKIQVT